MDGRSDDDEISSILILIADFEELYITDKNVLLLGNTYCFKGKCLLCLTLGSFLCTWLTRIDFVCAIILSLGCQWFRSVQTFLPSTTIGALKFNFPPFKKIMTDCPTNKPSDWPLTNQLTNWRTWRLIGIVTLPTTISITGYPGKPVVTDSWKAYF